MLTGTSEAIVVRIYGPDLDVLYAKADEVSNKLQNIPSLVDAHADLQEEVPQLEVEVNLAAAQDYGIKPGDVRRQASTLVASEEVGDIFRGGKAYDVHVWSTPETRHNVPACASFRSTRQEASRSLWSRWLTFASRRPPTP